MGNYYARFGGGRMEKGSQGDLASRLPYSATPITEARLVGLSIASVPAELRTLHGLSETTPLAAERIPQLLPNSVIIEELSKGDLQKYMQRWRSTGKGLESEPSPGE